MIETPDGADDGTTAEAIAAVAPPRRDLDTLRDIVLETALAWEAAKTEAAHGRTWTAVTQATADRATVDHLDAIRAYRAARDS